MIAMETCNWARMAVCRPMNRLELERRRVCFSQLNFARTTRPSGLLFCNKNRCGALQCQHGEVAKSEKITGPIDMGAWEVNAFEEQVSGPQTTPETMKKLKIGIIGFGNFGQFLAERFRKQGHRVVAFSRSDYKDVACRMRVSFHTYVAHSMSLRLSLSQRHLLFNH